MKIGLTYDLRSEYLAAGYGEEETAEFDRDDTIEALEKTLAGLGHHTERIGHARSLIEKLAAGRRWDLIFNIAEGMNGIGREGQVPAILDVYGIPYTFSDALVMALTLHKGMTKHVLRDAGVATADFVVAGEIGDIDQVTFEPPYFIKPVAEGTGKGVTSDSIVRRRKHLAAACLNCAIDRADCAIRTKTNPPWSNPKKEPTPCVLLWSIILCRRTAHRMSRMSWPRPMP